MKRLLEELREVQIIEHYQTFLRLKIGGKMKVGSIFEAIERWKYDLKITHYSVKEASVEQILNKFAEEDR